MDMIGNCEQVKIEQNIYSTSNEPYFLIMSYFLEHCALSALHSHVYTVRAPWQTAVSIILSPFFVMKLWLKNQIKNKN